MSESESSPVPAERVLADNRRLQLELARARALLVEEREGFARDLAASAERLEAAVARRKRVAAERDRALQDLSASLWRESRAIRLTARVVRRLRRARS